MTTKDRDYFPFTQEGVREFRLGLPHRKIKDYPFLGEVFNIASATLNQERVEHNLTPVPILENNTRLLSDASYQRGHFPGDSCYDPYSGGICWINRDLLKKVGIRDELGLQIGLSYMVAHEVSHSVIPGIKRYSPLLHEGGVDSFTAELMDKKILPYFGIQFPNDTKAYLAKALGDIQPGLPYEPSDFVYVSLIHNVRIPYSYPEGMRLVKAIESIDLRAKSVFRSHMFVADSWDFTRRMIAHFFGEEVAKKIAIATPEDVPEILRAIQENNNSENHKDQEGK